MSLRLRVLLWQLLSLLILLAVSCLLIYLLANQLAGQIYDEHLLNSADSVVGRIEDDTDKIDVDLPTTARTVLRHQDKDNFYYQVLRSDNKLIDCDEFIPLPRVRAKNKKPVYYEGIIDGNKVRILETRMLDPTNPQKFLYVEVAETLNTRRAFARKILFTLLLMLLLFIACSVLSMWVGLGRGLLPLRSMQNYLALRNPSDLQPVSLDNAPTEVLSLVKTINRLLSQVSDHILAQTRFAANVAHQLRTPLAGVKTYVDLAFRYSTEPRVREVLEQIDQGVQRLISLIEKMLLLARSDPALISTKIDSIVDLNAIVLETIAELTPVANKKEMNLDFCPLPHPVEVHGDPVSLLELIKNIIENAITYSPVASTVHIDIEVGEQICIIVKDNGFGIPINERERVFEPFYRLSANNIPGTGLGLAIARDIARAHLAQITLENNNGAAGTKVVIKFLQTGKQL